MGLDPKLLEEIVKQLEKMIPLREEIVEWLKAFIDDVKRQEIAVNSVKTTATAVGVLSTIALFTPLAPLGVAGLVGASAAGIATTIGDFIANKIKGGNLFEKAKSMTEDDLKLNELVKKVEPDAQLLPELNAPGGDAILFPLADGAAAVLGKIGAVIGVADAIYGWATKNPTRESAEALLRDLEERVATLKMLKEELSNLKY